jgi:SAM-dependent methyltransferase
VTPDDWDAEAARFDDEPDHGLADPAHRAAWRDLLLAALPPVPARIADLGCGTGTLSELLVEQGFEVTGLDFSPVMLDRARAKVPQARFVLGDAARAAGIGGDYDAIVCRHVLWALPDPATVLSRWADLLLPRGRLLLIEGRWHTGGGIRGTEALGLLADRFTDVTLRRLSEPVYWGGETGDERYLAVGVRSAAAG